MIAVLDTGTTNTRAYILDGEEVVARAYAAVGVRDTAITGSSDKLKKGIVRCIGEAAEKAGIMVGELESVVASGMIVSEMGLIDIPHLEAPVDIGQLVDNAVILQDLSIFPIDIPVVFIPGVRNESNLQEMEDLERLDFMKGEETQVFGALASLKKDGPINVIFFSSHTKVISVDAAGKITGSITSLSGQLYEAIRKQTFIGKSIEDEVKDFYDENIVEHAFAAVRKFGLLRALVMPRFMEVLIKKEAYERRLFVEAALAADDFRMMAGFNSIEGLNDGADFIFIGYPSRCGLWEKLLVDKGYEGNITMVSDKEAIDQLTVTGSLAVYNAVKEMSTIGAYRP